MVTKISGLSADSGFMAEVTCTNYNMSQPTRIFCKKCVSVSCQLVNTLLRAIK